MLENSGPLVWNNWKNAESGSQAHSTYEFRLYSDAHFIGEKAYGPYSFVNTVAQRGDVDLREILPVLLVRVDWYGQRDNFDMKKTRKEGYHGGYFPDEIAALISLLIGVKAEAGPIDRVYHRNSEGKIVDPFGRPRAHSQSLLPASIWPTTRPRIPWLCKDSRFEELFLLNTLPRLCSSTATALITSARQFQKACWLSDADPNTSWLLFVSSLETVAQHWDSTSGTVIDKLSESHHDLTEILKAKLDQDELQRAAIELRKVTGATNKFLSFCLRYPASPPETRPTQCRISFEGSDLRSALRKIYEHRSLALHGGISFPSPICLPPTYEGGGNVPNEKPAGLGFGTNNHSWAPDECPMYLHTFAYIVRQTLLNWWADAVKSS
ncbi:hypothetical protein SAMN02744133_108195 [Thalassospira xiamenensis M-5 = DSM 17429]|uniref:Apea-like HEPN domain-containing protein n=1 Tax=Thalassospira xiamenensis M-5 = DSM 17429 TaxID=1123366 RepID=A0AB72UK91_9PROT|nr:hypothetical protein [Thalassospira xiamenensis]AJD54464.1 hypothetical protein TH3_21958 [Thalassospira xiamenensis M-5 = DSM 17429]SIT22382.1 hypothetical protein SAMN02744133_108195 [Thalassospira xiamenensis M-5 = DSM 17429]